MNLDFVAMAEIFMTPTASLADIVFPVAHQYEMNDIGHYGIGHGMILARPKIVDPPQRVLARHENHERTGQKDLRS